ncbi:MAG: carboxypeptidase regulatory-like domain-containing protein, partial [Akkermansiaceae bacterium]|nr:carboxypeptidase regulatory-like domain-containing protein [Akkermansiaceae bacterium]
EGNFFDVPIAVSPPLRPGRNVVAVEIHQANARSSDLGFDLELGGFRRLAPTDLPPTDRSPVVPGNLPKPDELPPLLVASGLVTTDDGRVARGARVMLRAAGDSPEASPGESLSSLTVDGSGRYTIVHRVPIEERESTFVLESSRGYLASERVEVRPRESRQEFDLELRDRAPLSGEVLTFDESPLGGVIVQVLRSGEEPVDSDVPAGPVATTLSDERGRYRFPSLSPGSYAVRAQVPGGFAEAERSEPVVIGEEGQLGRVDFHLPAFKKGTWKHWTHAEGLPDN